MRDRWSVNGTLLATGLIAAGCASGMADLGKMSNQAGEAAIDTLLPVSEENKIGQKVAAELEGKVKLLANEPVQQYIRDLGAKVVAAAGGDTPKGIRYTFKVIDDAKTVNAFAMPGGHIYVYTGLMKKAANEAELMSVISHEVAHVTRRHIAQNLIAANGIDAITKLALGENPGLVGQLASGIAANGFLLKYSRDNEREADKMGLMYEIREGYDPHGFITFFNKIKTGEPGFLAIIQSHPPTEERIADLQKQIQARGNVPTNTGAEAYQAILAQLG